MTRTLRRAAMVGAGLVALPVVYYTAARHFFLLSREAARQGQILAFQALTEQEPEDGDRDVVEEISQSPRPDVVGEDPDDGGPQPILLTPSMFVGLVTGRDPEE